MHDHGPKPYLCFFKDCDRAQEGNGFPRRWNLFDHMRRVHEFYETEPSTDSPNKRRSPNPPTVRPTKEAKFGAPDRTIEENHSSQSIVQTGTPTIVPEHQSQSLHRNWCNRFFQIQARVGSLDPIDPRQWQQYQADTRTLQDIGLSIQFRRQTNSPNFADSNVGDTDEDQFRQEAPAMAQDQSEKAHVAHAEQDRAPAAALETKDVITHFPDTRSEVPRKRAHNTAAARKSPEDRMAKAESTDLACQPQGREIRRKLLGNGLSKGLAESIKSPTPTMTYMLKPTTPNFSENSGDLNENFSHQEGFPDFLTFYSRIQSRLPRPSPDLSSTLTTDQTVSKVPPKPVCWDHGCNGRQFSTFSNLLRHQRAKAGISNKPCCPRCGAEFTRVSARDGHMQHDKCKPRALKTTSSDTSPVHLSKEIQISRSTLVQVPLSALSDSGCRSGNWISGELVQRLGKTSEVIPIDHAPIFVDVLGYDLVPQGQIDLELRWGSKLEVHVCPFNVLPSSSHGIDLIFGSSHIISEAPLEVLEIPRGRNQVEGKEHGYGQKGEPDDGNGDKNDEKSSDDFHAYDDVASGVPQDSNDDAHNDLQEIISNPPAVPPLCQPLSTQPLLHTGKDETPPVGVRIQHLPSLFVEKVLVSPLNEENKLLETFRLEQSNDYWRTDDSVKKGPISRPGNTESKVQDDEMTKVLDATDNDSGRNPMGACYDIKVTEEKETGFTNRMKTYVEGITQESWDWWPLEPVYRSLKSDEVRIQWRCVCLLRNIVNKILLTFA